MTAEATTQLPDGRTVVDREPAVLVGVGKNKDARVTLVGVSRVMLSDETVTYMCEEDDCFWLHDNAQSISTHHQKKHAADRARKQLPTREKGVTNTLIIELTQFKQADIAENGYAGWPRRVADKMNAAGLTTARGNPWDEKSISNFSARYAGRGEVLIKAQAAKEKAKPVVEAGKADVDRVLEGLRASYDKAEVVESTVPIAPFEAPIEVQPVLNGTVQDPAGVFADKTEPSSKIQDLIEFLVDLEAALPEIIEALTLVDGATALAEKARKYDEMKERFFA